MPTRSMSATACRRAASAPIASCERMTWAMASPTRSTGFSDDIGSWKIMAMREPRRACMSRAGRSSRDAPSKVMRPPTRAVRGTRPRIARAVRLLPEPLSPTSPSASPGAMENEMPRTARTRPPPKPTVSPSTARPRSDTAGSGTVEPAYGIGEAVADEADEEAYDNDRQPREEHDPGRGDDEVAAFG